MYGTYFFAQKLSTSESTTASDQYTLFRIVVKVNQPAQTIISPTNNTITSSLYVNRGGPIWAGRHCHFGSPYRVYRCPHRRHPLLATNYTLFEIAIKVNQPAQNINSLTNDTTTRMCAEEVQFGLATSTTLGHHIVCSAAHIGVNRC